jgi:hypothetical protein
MQKPRCSRSERLPVGRFCQVDNPAAHHNGDHRDTGLSGEWTLQVICLLLFLTTLASLTVAVKTTFVAGQDASDV